MECRNLAWLSGQPVPRTPAATVLLGVPLFDQGAEVLFALTFLYLGDQPQDLWGDLDGVDPDHGPGSTPNYTHS